MNLQDPITFVEAGEAGSLPRHYLRAALHIALLPGRSHGYDLVEQVKLFGLSTVDLAGIYRSLKSMEHDGLACSEWESSELGPPRRVYELTSLGHATADHHREALRVARDHLSAMVNFASAEELPIGTAAFGRNVR